MSDKKKNSFTFSSPRIVKTLMLDKTYN